MHYCRRTKSKYEDEAREIKWDHQEEVSKHFHRLHGVLLDVVVVDDDVEPGGVLLVVGDLGKVERLQLRKHANHGRPETKKKQELTKQPYFY